MKRLLSAVCALTVTASLMAGMTVSGLTATNPANTAVTAGAGDENYLFWDNFEDGLGDWSGRGLATVSVSSENANLGIGSMFVTGRTAAWNGAMKALGADFVPGEAYSFSANAMSPDADATICMKLQYTDASGETKYSSIAEGEAKKGEWVTLANRNYTIPEGAENIQLYLETAEGTDDFYADDIFGAPGGTIPGGGGGAFMPIVRGDVNWDGVVDVFDLVLAKQYVLNGKENYENADVDQDGKTGLTDVILLYKYIHKLIDSFPYAELPTEPPTEAPTEATTAPDIPANNPWDSYVETASPEMQGFYADAIYQLGNTTRLREKIAKAQDGENVTLAYIGGSITEGGRTDTCYVSRSAKYFADTFGTGNNVSFINAGLSGTSSVVGLMRAQKDILDASPDIIFIEFSVNDHPEMIYKKGYESLVKRCLSEPDAPAVVLIINRAKGGYSMQEQMAAIGKNYDLPIISMDNALTNAFNSGLLTVDDYYTDEYHPHEAGNALIADSIAYFYRQVLKTENFTGAYTIPETVVYGTEYQSGTIVSLDSLNNFSSGSFAQSAPGYGPLPYTLKHSAGGDNTPMTFTTTGKGIFIVFSANQSNTFGNINVTVNGQTTTISGNKLYAWGGPETDVAYMQDTAGDLNVSIEMENAGTEFTIWGIGVVK